jgi:hypothetical protein
MSTDMVKMETQNLQAWMANANALADATLLPPQYRKNPANILLAIQTGAPLGFGALESINGINVIDGKPGLNADLIQAAVRKAGHRLRFTGDDTFAEAVLIRADDPDFEFKVRWDMERAEQAGLTRKDNWRHYPAAMLRSRAIAEVARMGAADALHGVIYTPEELEASAPTIIEQAQKEKPVLQAPKTELFPADRWGEWSGHIKAAQTKDDLRDLYRDARNADVLKYQVPDSDLTFGQLIQECSNDLPDSSPDQSATETAEVVADQSTGEVVDAAWPEEAATEPDVTNG